MSYLFRFGNQVFADELSTLYGDSRAEGFGSEVCIIYSTERYYAAMLLGVGYGSLKDTGTLVQNDCPTQVQQGKVNSPSTIVLQSTPPK